VNWLLAPRLENYYAYEGQHPISVLEPISLVAAVVYKPGHFIVYPPIEVVIPDAAL